MIVDRDKCQGHNRCFAEAPELFELDDELKSVVKHDPL
ncbi:ferredoxin, partial [Salmonella sp. SAL4444]